MTWVIIIGCVAIGWLTAIWAFLSGSKKLNEKWDLDNRYLYERMRMDAERRSLEAFSGDTESSGPGRELSTSRSSPKGKVRWGDNGNQST